MVVVEVILVMVVILVVVVVVVSVVVVVVVLVAVVAVVVVVTSRTPRAYWNRISASGCSFSLAATPSSRSAAANTLPASPDSNSVMM